MSQSRRSRLAIPALLGAGTAAAQSGPLTLFMAYGRIIEQGRPEALFSAPGDKRLRRFLRHLEPQRGG